MPLNALPGRLPGDRRLFAARHRNRFDSQYTEFAGTLEESLLIDDFIDQMLTHFDRPINSETQAEIRADLESRIADGSIEAESLGAYFQPPGFGWLPFTVMKQANGTAVAVDAAGEEWDVESMGPVPSGNEWFVSVNGNDTTGDGLTALTPFRSLNKAHTQASTGDTIRVMTGLSSNLFSIPELSKSLRFISHDGVTKHIGTYQLNPTWTSNGNNVYWTVRAGTLSVWDSSIMDGDDYTRLVPLASVAAVEAQPGSYFFESGTNRVYTHAPDSRSLVGDTAVRIFINVSSMETTTEGINCYFENLEFQGGRSNGAFFSHYAGVGQRQVLAFKNCNFKYGASQNGLSIRGADVYLQDCTAAWNFVDGFNYHVNTGGLECRVVEIGCVGRDNGKTGASANTNNGTSMHEDGFIARVNCEAYGNKGPNIVDVTTSTSWCVQCYAHDSDAEVDGQRVNFYFAGDQAWIDECDSDDAGAESFLDLYLDDSAIVMIREFDMEGNTQVDSGVLSGYDDFDAGGGPLKLPLIP